MNDTGRTFRLRSRWYSRGLAAAGGLCLAMAFGLSSMPQHNESLTIAGSPKRIVTGAVPGRNYEIQFHVKNSSDTPKRIVGGTCVV